MRQFHKFKAKYPDCILFFRMGDFYETFYDDAKTCSKVLGLTLTSRDKGANPIPLAGVPYHAVEGYLKKMLQAGYKVAVCEQIENPKTAKGVVKRDVVRVVTPGTITDENLLDAKQENFLAAVWQNNAVSAISWVDISTGHFFVQPVSEGRLLDELLLLGPKECLLPDSRGELFEAQAKRLSADITQLTGAIATERPSWYFDPYQARQRLLKHFGTATLEGFGIADTDNALIPPAGAVIEYLNETQRTTLSHICSIKRINRKKYLQIDQTSLTSLEVLRTIRTESKKGSLLECLDETLTPMGGRMFRNWLCMPLYEPAGIELRQDAVEDFKQTLSRANDIRRLLTDVADTERIAARISTARVNPRDLLALACTLRLVPEIREILKKCTAELLKNLAEHCDSMDELAGLLESAIEPGCPAHLRDGGVIRTGFHSELDGLRSISRDGQSWLSRYQKTQIERTGITRLKIGFNKVFGYYIEVSHSAADKVPPDYVRKQTIKNAERYITDELKHYETKALGAEEKAIELEQRLFDGLRLQAAKYIRRLQKLADTLAQCDCLTSLAYLANRRNYTRPKITAGTELNITEGKHPVLAETLGHDFVANDVELGGDDDVLIITGPNMSGKSTYIRQTALLVLMAQAGSFIPAKQATIGLVDRIFTRVGASDELTRGQSTFMVEMTETANIINNASGKSLVILDEVGRGTSTYDGLSLAWAITEHIANKIKCRTLFATHYHELTELAELLANVKNCNVAVREWMDEVVFLHKILPGGTDKSYGIHVAKLAGVPRPILDRSKEILEQLEQTFQKEAAGTHLAKHKTTQSDPDSLFVAKHKSVLDKLVSTDINRLTPIEAINLLNHIKKEMEDR